MTIEINTPVSKFLKKISIFLDNCGLDPLPGSPAEKEIRSFSRPKSVETAFSTASQLLIAANDYLKALDSLVDQEIFSVAPWSCARGMLEASAICTWLFDKGIDPRNALAEVCLLGMHHCANKSKWQDMMIIMH